MPVKKPHPKKRRALAVDGDETPKVESRALAKGLLLLESLAVENRPLSLRELAPIAGLGKPSTLRLLQTLVVTGFATKNENGDYCLNRRWVPSSTEDWLRRLRTCAQAPLARLNADLAETVSLAALLEDHVRVIEVLESPQHIRLSNYRDRILPPYASSLGKAIAAYQTPETLQRLLDVYGVYRHTEKTHTEPLLIRQDLAQVLERGWAAEVEETVPGGCCFGVPIRIPGEPVRAAISAALPTIRLTPHLEKALPKALTETAQSIARAMKSKKT